MSHFPSSKIHNEAPVRRLLPYASAPTDRVRQTQFLMAIYQSRSYRGGSILGILLFVLSIVAVVIVAKGVFKLLAFIAPVLLIIALVLNYKVVTGFVTTIWNLLRRNPLAGILAIVLCVVFHPLVAAYLAVRAGLSRKLKNMQEDYIKRRDGELVDYTEVREETLELPRRPAQRQAEPRVIDTDYEELFD